MSPVTWRSIEHAHPEGPADYLARAQARLADALTDLDTAAAMLTDSEGEPVRVLRAAVEETRHTLADMLHPAAADAPPPGTIGSLEKPDSETSAHLHTRKQGTGPKKSPPEVGEP